MTITVDLPPRIETMLRQTTARRDPEALRQLLVEAVTPVVEALLRQPPAEGLEADEAEALLDRLAARFEAFAGSDVAPLPPEALTRAGIYREHA